MALEGAHMHLCAGDVDRAGRHTATNLHRARLGFAVDPLEADLRLAVEQLAGDRRHGSRADEEFVTDPDLSDREFFAIGRTFD